MPTRVRNSEWDAQSAVQTTTQAVRQDGETDLEFEHRNEKVRISQALHNWAEGKNLCATADAVLNGAGLACRPGFRHPQDYGYKTIGQLRGERTRKGFETFKRNCATYLNQQARRHGHHTDQLRSVLESVGLDPTLGVPPIRKATITVNVSYPWSYEVQTGRDGTELGPEETLRQQGLWNIADRVVAIIDPDNTTHEGEGSLTVTLVEDTPQDAPTEES